MPRSRLVRVLTPQDTDAIARVLADDGGYALRVDGRPADATTAHGVLTERPPSVAEADHHVLGMWLDDGLGRDLVALASLVVGWPRADVTWLGLLQVRADHHGEGIARELHEELRRRFPGRWELAVVDTNDRVLPFWEHLGYTRTGEVRRWASESGTEHAATVMTSSPAGPATLRRARATDCPAILEVMFSTAMSRESTWWRTTVGDLETRLAEGGGFVAVDGDTIIGCVMHVREGDRLALRGLAVRPEAEGQGIGSALVSAVESVAVADGLAEVLLAVSASNLEVSDFYRRLGYTDSDEPYAHAAAGRPAPAVLVKRLPSPTARPTSRP